LKQFIRRHWRGEYSLPRAFWVNIVLLNLVILIVSVILVDSVYAEPAGWWVIAVMVTVMIINPCVVGSWQIIGTWRSANRHPSRFWTVVTQLYLGVAALHNVALTAAGLSVFARPLLLPHIDMHRHLLTLTLSS
jgi:hypothetical protein